MEFKTLKISQETYNKLIDYVGKDKKILQTTEKLIEDGIKYNTVDKMDFCREVFADKIRREGITDAYEDLPPQYNRAITNFILDLFKVFNLLGKEGYKVSKEDVEDSLDCLKDMFLEGVKYGK